MKHRILLVDDDLLSLSATQMVLEGHEYAIDTATTGSECLQRVKTFGNNYSLILLDYRLGTETGESVAKLLMETNPDLYILIYSGDSSREAVKTTWTAGAVGFLEKGGEPSELRASVANWCAKHRETKQRVSLSTAFNENSESIASLKMIGRSAKMAAIAKQVKRYKTLQDNVLILGETGTGKERIAQALHAGDSSQFLPVNCAAYSANTELMEGELFGYGKGAFTGAVKDHVGVFESAKGGTVFLDEVHTLSKVAQQKLLRVIQEKKIRRVGSTKEIAVQFRLLAAAKPEIEQQVEEGTFLPDLFERLNVLSIHLAPLRERKEDIEPLVAFFTAQYEKDTGEKRAILFKTLRYLERYPWPRNVRELENTVRRLCINTPVEKIEPEHLDAKFFQADGEQMQSLMSQKEEVLKKNIETALLSHSSQREAAKSLQIPESSLRRQMKKLNVRHAALAILIVLAPNLAFSIFEGDDRHDLNRYRLDSPARKVADAVALMTIDKSIEPIGNGRYKLRSQTFGESQINKEEPLCQGERFQGQPVAREKAGTGFLVAPDLLITAGHVIENSTECEQAAIVFGYGYFSPWSEPLLITEANLYTCKEVIYTQNNAGGDIALIRLDRPVTGHRPLTVRKSGKLSEQSVLWMAGHPLTLPLKITENGMTLSASEPNHFYSSLDTYAGNSGGPVFDPRTGLVEGVLIEGEQTEITLHGEWPGGCWYSKVYCDKANTEKFRCDTTEYTGAKSTRIELLWKYLP